MTTKKDMRRLELGEFCFSVWIIFSMGKETLIRRYADEPSASMDSCSVPCATKEEGCRFCEYVSQIGVKLATFNETMDYACG